MGDDYLFLVFGATNIVACILVSLGRDVPDSIERVVEVENDRTNKQDDSTEDCNCYQIKRGIGVDLEKVDAEEREGDHLEEDLEQSWHTGRTLRDPAHAGSRKILK